MHLTVFEMQDHHISRASNVSSVLHIMVIQFIKKTIYDPFVHVKRMYLLIKKHTSLKRKEKTPHSSTTTKRHIIWQMSLVPKAFQPKKHTLYVRISWRLPCATHWHASRASRDGDKSNKAYVCRVKIYTSNMKPYVYNSKHINKGRCMLWFLKNIIQMYKECPWTAILLFRTPCVRVITILTELFIL